MTCIHEFMINHYWAPCAECEMWLVADVGGQKRFDFVEGFIIGECQLKAIKEDQPSAWLRTALAQRPRYKTIAQTNHGQSTTSHGQNAFQGKAKSTSLIAWRNSSRPSATRSKPKPPTRSLFLNVWPPLCWPVPQILQLRTMPFEQKIFNWKHKTPTLWQK